MDTSTPNRNTLKKLILWKLFKIKKIIIQGLKMTFRNYSRWPKAVESELGRGGRWEWHGGSGQTCVDSSALAAHTDKDEILKPVESSSLAPPLPFYTDNEFHRHSRRGVDARKTLSLFLYRFSLSSRVLGCCCCCRCLLMVVGWLLRGEMEEGLWRFYVKIDPDNGYGSVGCFGKDEGDNGHVELLLAQSGTAVLWRRERERKL